MSAATCICTTPNPQAFPTGPLLVTSLQMPVLVSIVAFGAAFVILVDQAFQRIQLKPQRMAPANR